MTTNELINEALDRLNKQRDEYQAEADAAFAAGDITECSRYTARAVGVSQSILILLETNRDLSEVAA